MNEFKIHKLLCELIEAWESTVSPEECLENVLRYNNDVAGRKRGVTELAVKQIVEQNKCSNPDKFISKYEFLKAKKLDILGPFMNLLMQLKDDRRLSEILKRKFQKENKELSLISVPFSCPTARNTVKHLKEEDVPQVCSKLSKIAAQLQGKKSSRNKKSDGRTAQTSLTDFTNWSTSRPHMSMDFIDEANVSPAGPISAVPSLSQESILIEDLLSCLHGFHGKYITAEPLTNPFDPRTFQICDTVDPSLRDLVQQILPLASHYSVIVRFIQDKRQCSWGRVNHALTAAMDSLIKDYLVFVVQLETQHRRHHLDLHKVWYYAQATFYTMEVLAKMATTISLAEARGGRTLTILHDETAHSLADSRSQELCHYLTQAAAVPYFQSLHRWISKGIVFDPYDEFMIDDNVSMETDLDQVTGQCSDEYWSKRYTIKSHNVPEFLEPVQEIILRTGKYLNVIRQCNELSLTGKKFSVSSIETMVYTLKGCDYLDIIKKAYQSASKQLLNVLLSEYDIINRIRSVKRYFLLEQGDFIVQLMDLCEEELTKPIEEATPNRLQALMELTVRTSLGKHDPYKDDITLTLLPYKLPFQIFKILSITTEEEKDYKKHESLKNMTALDAFTFSIHSKWPLSLIFNQKVLGSYQMFFRQLLFCKHVDRCLCKVWICDKAVKVLPRRQATGYLCAFSLRQRMLFCIQNLEYYMMAEVIEPQWLKFLDRMQKVNNIDDVLNEHWSYLSCCLKDCMFMNPVLMRTIRRLMSVCLEFCDFIQEIENSLLNKQNQSFSQNIARLDEEFTQLLVLLLKTIATLGREENVDKLCNILYREDFNSYYSKYLENDKKTDSTVNAKSVVSKMSG
ncbi:gamma-tubulin complex component 2-like isoform X2 [Lycorma delicatula]|uniref:gamma-tubulin complex component 2-like isoform X2 n=1 Tax=Lycorma delicatula TaxID=130591 RepID=UPI003F51029B